MILIYQDIGDCCTLIQYHEIYTNKYQTALAIAVQPDIYSSRSCS